MDLKQFIGQSTGPRRIEYTWRDVALYALAVGAEEDDLDLIFEKNMKTLPTFGSVPYWNAVNNYPQRPTPFPGAFMVRQALERELGKIVKGLHMEHTLLMHRPIDPIKGTLVFEDTITEIYDRGEGKGIIVETKVPVYDEAGNLLCENISNTMFFECGGFGGPAPVKSTVEIPDRAPDFEKKDTLSKTANMLYRLTGDTNRVHADPEVAKEEGFPRPFMQGLCSLGYAGRMAIREIIPGGADRVTKVSAQMRNICFPGATVVLRAWKQEDGKAVFQLINEEDGKPILDKGQFEYRS